MAIKNFFKSKDEPDRERSLRDPEQILAWLEELARIRTVLDLVLDPADPLPIGAKVELVGEETRSFTLSLQRTPHPEPSSGHRASLTFSLDGRRFQTDLVYMGRGGYREYRFQLPAAIRHGERRDATRVHFRVREKFQLVALQSLFDGLGLSGELTDLSLYGCAFLLTRAIRIRDERRVPIRVDLLPAGTQLDLVRLPDLPNQPVLECTAKVTHLRQGPKGVVVGMRFEHLGPAENAILEAFMAFRMPGFQPDFPRKRRARDLSEEEKLIPQGAPAEEAPEPQEPAAPEDEAASAFSDTEIAELREVIRDGAALKNLRKRCKKILLVMPDVLERTLLGALLKQDGYRSVYQVPSLIQALEAQRRKTMDLVIVEQVVGPHGALEVIETLRQGASRPTPALVIQRQPDPRLAVAARAGGILALVEHPADFATRLQPVLEGLLGF